MSNLSLTACSFHFRKAYSKGNTQIFNLNEPLTLQTKDGKQVSLSDLSELFIAFFKAREELIKDDIKQQSFRCEYNEDNYVETDDFRMFFVKIYSGIYGSASEIIDGKTEKLKFKKSASDIDTKPFYLAVVFPKDNEKVTVQKGLFIFQNVGQFGVKTVTTSLMQSFLSSNFEIALKCNTISRDLFIKKIVRADTIKKLVMVKNIKSVDISDNIQKGYGKEVREIGNLCFNEKTWNRIMDKIRYVAGARFRLFEFEQIEYDKLKVIVDIGGRFRTISMHNLENLSIIEGIPDEVRMADGHPDLSALSEHFVKVVGEYLDEMVLSIA